MKKRIISNSSPNMEQKPIDRIDRLAKEMRENLKKRKAQAKAQGRAPIKQIKEI